MIPAVAPRLPLPRRLVVLLVAALATALTLIVSPPAYADAEAETDAAIAAFQDGTRVFVSPSAEQQVDVAAVTAAIGELPVYVAVLGPNVPVNDALFAVPNVLSGEYTVVVISGTEFALESTAYCLDQADGLLGDTATANDEARLGGDLTSWLSDFAGQVDNLDAAGSAACANAGPGGGGDSSAVFWWILGALVVIAGLVFWWLRTRQQRQEAELAALRREAGALLARLGAEIDQARPTADQLTLRALQDSAARHDAAVDQLEAATSADEIAAARQAVIEGLTASYVARERVGQPTEQVPALPAANGDRLEGAQQIDVDGELVYGFPQYTPGAPFYHPGGAGYSAGWYSAPAWEGAIIGAVLGPAGDDERPDADDEQPGAGASAGRG